MVIIAGTIQMDPDKVADAMPAIVALMTATWAEDGCIDYVSSADPVRAGGIRIFEKWESDEALAPHMAEFQQKAGDFGITAMSVERFDGATASKLI